MVLRGRRIPGVDLDGCGVEGGFRIPDLRILMLLRGLGTRDDLDAVTVEAGGRRLLGVADDKPVGSVARSLETIGEHDSDDLSRVEDLRRRERHDRRADIAAVREKINGPYLTRHVLVGENVEHARDGARLTVIDARHVATGDRAHGKEGEDRARQVGVRTVAGSARDLGRPIDASCRATQADEVELCGIGHDHTFMLAACQKRPRQRSPPKLDLECIVATGRGGGQGQLARMRGALLIHGFADKRLFRRLGAPRFRRDASQRDARFPHRFSVHVERNGRRSEREFVGLPIADLEIERAPRP